MRLHELHIQNFKFFPKHDPKSPLLEIGGKNLLIYGENGSGKSTIYWAIYTLLESAFKVNEFDVEKYFQKGGEYGLVNIHATKTKPPYIKMVLKDDAGNNPKEYEVNPNLHQIVANMKDSAIRESGMASDFINYRVLFRLHHVKHSKDNDLFGWFEDEIFPYILIEKISKVKSIADVFMELKDGPPKVNAFDEPGKKVFPNPAMKDHKQEAVKKDYKLYQKYTNQLKRFNTRFNTWLKERVKRANEILKHDFEQNFEIKLDYIPAKANVTEDDPGWESPKIVLKVPKYEGKRDVVRRAHSFLNEAKWTSIGLALRFAIIEDTDSRPDNPDLKLLTIDDMLLSLDMSNRDVVLNLILNEYASKTSFNFQVIMMTHDRSFYEFTKRKIETSGRKKDWLIMEMYQDELTKFPQPYFKPTKTSLQTADDYFKQHDYPACAIYLRKEIERCLTNLLPPKYRKVEDRNDPNKLVDAKLNDMLLNLEAYCNEDGIDYSELADLKTFKDALLNPLAHNDLDTPLFREELKKLMKAMAILEKKDRARPFHKSNKNMNFNLTKPDGSYFSVRMKSKESVVLIEEEGKPPRISVFSKCKVSGIDNNGTVTNIEENFDTLREVHNEMSNRFGIASQQDISREFDYDGKTFDQKITEMGL